MNADQHDSIPENPRSTEYLYVNAKVTDLQEPWRKDVYTQSQKISPYLALRS